VRIPAHEIEPLVTQTLGRFLSNPKGIGLALAEHSGSLQKPIERRDSALRICAQWKKRTADHQRELIKTFLSRVTVANGVVTIDLRILQLERLLVGEDSKVAMGESANGDRAAEPIHKLRVAASLVRAHGAAQLIVVPESRDAAASRPNEVLIRAIVREHRWHEELMSGQVSSITAIAKREQLPERYVGRILQYRFMAPDIIESILDGRQPSTLLLASLQKNIPKAWDEQRAVIGFHPISPRVI
jgi:site-specific DNA recombinase